MRPAREVAHAHCAEESTAGDWCAFSGAHLAERPHSYACDRLTAALEARDRELMEVAAKACRGEAFPHPGEVGTAWNSAVEHCEKAVRTLIPKEAP